MPKGETVPETDVATAILEKLKPDFVIEREVYGTHFSGKRVKVDAVVRPRDPSQWKRPDVALAIEFKDAERLDQSFDTKNYTKWLAQCIDYANTKWDNYGYLYIFASPGLVDRVPGHILGPPSLARRVMSQLGVGELYDQHRYGLTFILHEKHRIWSETKGLEAGKNYTLRRRFGSR